MTTTGATQATLATRAGGGAAARTTPMVRIGTGALLGVAAACAFAGTAEAKPRKKARIDPRLARAPLVLTSFVQQGRLDVGRNETLVFKFSSLIRRASVDSRTIRVMEQTSAGARSAAGALIPAANVVRFDPTRSQRNYDDSRRRGRANLPPDRPLGFASVADHVVEIPGPSEIHRLMNRRGERILQAFGGSFRTSARYEDPVPGQPSFVGAGGSGNLGFVPPKSASTGLVDEDAIVVLEFSEPIDLATMDPSTTVLVTRVSTGEPVPGSIRLAPGEPSGRTFHFVPSLGFGSDLANGTGWDVRVALTRGITDLAGNALRRAYDLPVFRTRFVPGKKAASLVVESFDDQTHMDPVTVPDGGEWNTLSKGFLDGGAPTTFPSQDVSLWLNPPAGVAVAFSIQNDPLNTNQGQTGCPFPRTSGSRGQFLYTAGDVGAAAAVVAIGWGPSSNALFGSAHDEITLRMGHTSNTALTADLDANANAGGLVQTYRGPYTIPHVKNIQPSDGVDAVGVTRDPPNGTPRGYWLYPAFTTPFEWNGANNLVVDVASLPATTCQILRAGFVGGGQPFPNRRAIATSYTASVADFAVEPMVYDLRFQKRRRTTRATSLWYALAAGSTQFGAPIVTPASQPGGVSVTVELEGAPGKPDPLVPGGEVPDTSKATGFTTSVGLLDGLRFVRFRVTMTANLSTAQTAKLASVAIPYVF